MSAGSKALTLSVLLILLASIFHPVSLGAAESSIIPIPQADESPLKLKNDALALLSGISATGEDAGKLADVVQHINASVNGTFWDDYHIKSGQVFQDEREAAQQLRVLIDRNKNSDIDKTALTPALTMLVQADRALAERSIADASSASYLVSDPVTLRNISDGIEKANSEYAKALDHIQNGDPVVAIEFFEKAWNYSGEAVSMADRISVPRVTITLPASGSYTNASLQTITGTVDDIALYSINGVSLSFNGETSRIPLVKGTFSEQVRLIEGKNVIRAAASDIYGNTGASEANVTLDTISPTINVTGVQDGKYYNVDVVPNIGIYDVNIRSYYVLLNGTPYSGSAISDEGNYSLEVGASDLAGNAAMATVNFTIDKTAPFLIVRELTDNPTLTFPEYDLYGDVEEGASLFINGFPVQHNGSFYYEANVTEGAFTTAICAMDIAGNTVSWTKTRLIDSDELPDYYEISVTGTDPLNGDSDSSMTVANEASNGIPDDLEDYDGDGLLTSSEYYLGLDPVNADTDEDGLPDAYELEMTGTFPATNDSDNNNVKDPDEDPDTDGLLNINELLQGTDPLNNDTDGDTLKDGYEISNSMDPLNKDTDNDGLQDDSEARLGTDPLVTDTDGDGVPDGDEYYVQTYNNSTAGVEVTFCARGDISKNVTIRLDDNGSVLIREIPGVYKAADIDPHANISWALVKLYYDPAAIGNLSNYSIFQLNANNSIEKVKVQGVNTEEHYLWANVTHFSDTFAADRYQWVDKIGAWYAPNKESLLYHPGDRIKINANVHNLGSGPAQNVKVKFTIAYRLGDPYEFMEVTVPYIAPHGTADASVIWTVKERAANVYVQVDEPDLIAETDESNNNAVKEIWQNLDSDGDGLSDYEEYYGMRVAFPIPRVHSLPDTTQSDYDWVSDPEEMGDYYYDQANKELFDSIASEYGITGYEYDGYHYQYRADPRLTDSDYDGANDKVELEAGTNPLDKYDPPFLLEAINGFFWGNIAVDDEQHSNMGYLTGMLISAVVPGWEWVATVRDTGADLYKQQWAMVGVDVFGGVLSVLPATTVADELPDIGGRLARFVGAHPEKISEVSQLVIRTCGDQAVSLLEYVCKDLIDLLRSKHASDKVIKTLLDSGLPDGVIKDLAKNSDNIPIAYDSTDGLVVGLTRYNTKVEVRYIDDGNAFINKLGGKSLSKAQLGENAARQMAKSRGYEVLGATDGFKKTSPYQEGFDVVCRDPKTNSIVIIEAKFLSDGDNVGSEILSTTQNGYQEMTDSWIRDAIERMVENNPPLISDELAEELRTASNTPGKIKKELVVVQNVPKNGNTIRQSLIDPTLGFQNVYLLKIGGVV